jgi:hypothetical protein
VALQDWATAILVPATPVGQALPAPLGKTGWGKAPGANFVRLDCLAPRLFPSSTGLYSPVRWQLRWQSAPSSHYAAN